MRSAPRAPQATADTRIPSHAGDRRSDPSVPPEGAPPLSSPRAFPDPESAHALRSAAICPEAPLPCLPERYTSHHALVLGGATPEPRRGHQTELSDRFLMITMPLTRNAGQRPRPLDGPCDWCVYVTPICPETRWVSLVLLASHPPKQPPWSPGRTHPPHWTPCAPLPRPIQSP